MSVLRIHLFGGVRVEHDGHPTLERITRAVQMLLTYLLLHRQRSHPRDVLAGSLWGDQSEDRARACLSTTLWRLRRVLEPDGVPRGTYLISTSRGEVGFNRASEHWFDVAVLEERASRGLNVPAEEMESADAVELEAALQLYNGELLEGVYSDWALRERERVRSLYLDGLARLMRYHKHHRAYEKGLVCGHRILLLDPLREEVHREMMRLYLACGQRALALRQYEACRQALAAELDVEPLEETQAVYAQIVPASRNRRAEPVLTGGEDSPALLLLLQRLHRARHGLDQARVQFQHAIESVERLAGSRARRR